MFYDKDNIKSKIIYLNDEDCDNMLIIREGGHKFNHAINYGLNIQSHGFKISRRCIFIKSLFK